MMKYKLQLLIVVGLVLTVGCGSTSDDAITPVANSTVGSPKTGIDKNGAQRSSAPGSSLPSEGIALEPRDPNNSIYKADPRLSGGG